jgi:hypothetical protein
MKGCKLSKGVFEKKKRKFATFRRKKKVKLAIIRALVLLCHKCIVEFEKNLLLSMISSQIWVVAMFSYLAKLKEYPDFTMGKLE